MPLLSKETVPQLLTNVIQKLNSAKIYTAVEFLFTDFEKIAKITHLRYRDIIEIRNALFAKHSAVVQNAGDLFEEILSSSVLFSSGCIKFDEFLGGGLFSGEILEIIGPPCSGKTQIALTLASTAVLETAQTVLYIDLKNSFSPRRILQILTSKNYNSMQRMAALKKLFHVKIKNITDLMEVLHCLKNKCPPFGMPRLIIIDSLAVVVSPLVTGNFPGEGQGIINSLALQLKELCIHNNCTMVIINNSIKEENSYRAALGNYWQHVPSVRLLTKPVGSEAEIYLNCESKLISVVLLKSPRKASGTDLQIEVSDGGFINKS